MTVTSKITTKSLIIGKQQLYNIVMGDVEPTSRECYQEIKRLWAEAANDDWRGEVKIIPGIAERFCLQVAKHDREHPSQAKSGPDAPTVERPTAPPPRN